MQRLDRRPGYTVTRGKARYPLGYPGKTYTYGVLCAFSSLRDNDGCLFGNAGLAWNIEDKRRLPPTDQDLVNR